MNFYLRVHAGERITRRSPGSITCAILARRRSSSCDRRFCRTETGATMRDVVRAAHVYGGRRVAPRGRRTSAGSRRPGRRLQSLGPAEIISRILAPDIFVGTRRSMGHAFNLDGESSRRCAIPARKPLLADEFQFDGCASMPLTRFRSIAVTCSGNRHSGSPTRRLRDCGGRAATRRNF